MTDPAPSIIVIAGPNGAGKSTAAPALLRDLLGVSEYVNADVIAQGLSAFAPEAAALQAGRVMLGRLRDLAAARRTFAFETTLAEGVRLERAMFLSLFGTPDQREGMAAFAEKRKPHFGR